VTVVSILVMSASARLESLNIRRTYNMAVQTSVFMATPACAISSKTLRTVAVIQPWRARCGHEQRGRGPAPRMCSNTRKASCMGAAGLGERVDELARHVVLGEERVEESG
jgi:hypothetical protein